MAMRKREKGQALLMVLVLLLIGVPLVTALLHLAFTSSKTSQVVTKDLKSLYAAEGGQAYVMWKLLHTNYINTFTYDGQEDTTTVDVCGTTVNISVTLRAVPSWFGVTLATNDRIKPSVTVTPDTNDGTNMDYIYTIRLEQISGDTSQGLEAVYDVLPDAFSSTSYQAGYGTWLSVDGGTPVRIGDPSQVVVGNQVRLRWPASGIFDDTISSFYPGQVKEISFKVQGSMGPNTTNYDWVILAPWNTLSGAQAPIVRGTGANPKNGLLYIRKMSDTSFILPNTPTPVRYTIAITNQQGSTDQILEINDYLPVGFTYTPGSTVGMTSNDPVATFENINGIDRWHLKWVFSPAISVAAGATTSLSFGVTAIQSDTGSYYNEMMVVPKNPVPTLFSSIGVTYEDFNGTYTWNASPVLVPAYDSETEADGTTIGARLGVGSGTVWVSSWQVR